MVRDWLAAPGSAEAMLALNNANAEALSLLSPAELERLLGQAFWVGLIGEADAFLIAFDQQADYDSPNFLWFRKRYPRFVYVDRVVVAAQARGRGLARALYQALIDKARAAGHARVVSEVNLDPPNPISDAFHAALGFAVIGEAVLPGGKAVRYWERRLDDPR